jgi:hypothetical protein
MVGQTVPRRSSNTDRAMLLSLQPGGVTAHATLWPGYADGPSRRRPIRMEAT